VTFRAGRERPPFLDARVIPHALERVVPARVGFRGPAAPAVRELVRRDVPPERLTGEPGTSPFEWYGAAARGAVRVDDDVVFEYLRAVYWLEFDELAGPASGREAGLAAPALVVTLHYDGGSEDSLVLGAPDGRGFRPLVNTTTGQLFRVTEEKAGRLVPDSRALLRRPAAGTSDPPRPVD
jgi:hypothetical protein